MVGIQKRYLFLKFFGDNWLYRLRARRIVTWNELKPTQIAKYNYKSMSLM